MLHLIVEQRNGYEACLDQWQSYNRISHVHICTGAANKNDVVPMSSIQSRPSSFHIFHNLQDPVEGPCWIFEATALIKCGDFGGRKILISASMFSCDCLLHATLYNSE